MEEQKDMQIIEEQKDIPTIDTQNFIPKINELKDKPIKDEQTDIPTPNMQKDMPTTDGKNKIPTIRAGKKVFHLYTMKNGVSITCHGRPKKTDLSQLYKEFKINYVLTILYPKEKPESVQKFCTEVSSDIYWDNLPLFGAQISYFLQKNTIELIIGHITELFRYIDSHPNTKIYLHCAAGLHRTGTILYTILRCSGESKETVMDAIKSIRYETYRDMGEKRIQYAEDYLVAPLLDILSKKNGDNSQ